MILLNQSIKKQGGGMRTQIDRFGMHIDLKRTAFNLVLFPMGDLMVLAAVDDLSAASTCVCPCTLTDGTLGHISTPTDPSSCLRTTLPTTVSINTSEPYPLPIVPLEL